MNNDSNNKMKIKLIKKRLSAKLDHPAVKQQRESKSAIPH